MSGSQKPSSAAVRLVARCRRCRRVRRRGPETERPPPPADSPPRPGTAPDAGRPGRPDLQPASGRQRRRLIVGYYGSGANAKHPNKGCALSSASSGTYTAENYPGSVQTQVTAVTSSEHGRVLGRRQGNNHGFIDWNGVFTTVDDPAAAGKTKTTQILGLNAAGVAVGFVQRRKATRTRSSKPEARASSRRSRRPTRARPSRRRST